MSEGVYKVLSLIDSFNEFKVFFETDSHHINDTHFLKIINRFKTDKAAKN